MTIEAHVVAVACDPLHRFSKPVAAEIELIAGRGVAGDAHCGETVRHRSRVAADPGQPNLRQVHLIHSELLESLQAQGFAVQAGELGENITTAGLDLLSLPVEPGCASDEAPRSRLRACAIRAGRSKPSAPAYWPPCSAARRTEASCARAASWPSSSAAGRPPRRHDRGGASPRAAPPAGRSLRPYSPLR